MISLILRFFTVLCFFLCWYRWISDAMTLSDCVIYEVTSCALNIIRIHSSLYWRRHIPLPSLLVYVIKMLEGLPQAAKKILIPSQRYHRFELFFFCFFSHKAKDLIKSKYDIIKPRVLHYYNAFLLYLFIYYNVYFRVKRWVLQMLQWFQHQHWTHFALAKWKANKAKVNEGTNRGSMVTS